jgi:CHAD domain-containing protein
LEGLGFELPEGYDAYQLAVGISERYVVKVDQPAVEDVEIFDTFDWRLLCKSLALYRQGNLLVLKSLADGSILSSFETSQKPGFAWDLPACELRDRLATVIEMRTLIKMAAVQQRTIPLRALNRNSKTVARLVHTDFLVPRPGNETGLVSQIWLLPIRGYNRRFRDLSNYLKDNGFLLCTGLDVHKKILATAGHDPGSYSSKLELRLSPEMRAEQATQLILRSLLQTMKLNEQGIQEDLDTEFLHDYRVAVRRTRSALALIGGVFPAEAVARYKLEFSTLGQLTNPLRDLDVYLLKERTYQGMLPPALRDYIQPLFEHLRARRSQALQAVVSGLNSTTYRTFIKDWEAFLEIPPLVAPSTPDAARPILAVAQERIYKHYRSVSKTSAELLKQPEDDRLHVLRIKCKKLRYLLEFFSSLFPEEKISYLVAQLKKLQDNLGDYNDFCVQIEYLLKMSEELPATATGSKESLLSIGYLVGRLEDEKQAMKGAIAGSMRDFAAPAIKQLFRELFADPVEGTGA